MWMWTLVTFNCVPHINNINLLHSLPDLGRRDKRMSYWCVAWVCTFCQALFPLYRQHCNDICNNFSTIFFVLIMLSKLCYILKFYCTVNMYIYIYLYIYIFFFFFGGGIFAKKNIITLIKEYIYIIKTAQTALWVSQSVRPLTFPLWKKFPVI